MAEIEKTIPNSSEFTVHLYDSEVRSIQWGNKSIPVVEGNRDYQMYLKAVEKYGPAPAMELHDTENKWNEVRAERDRRIAAIEWRVNRYRDQVDNGEIAEDDAIKYQEILAYVQALRDVPENNTDPDSISWPVAPE